MRVSKLSMNKKLNKRFNKYTKKQYGSGDDSSPNGAVSVKNMVGKYEKKRGMYPHKFGINQDALERVRVIPSNLQPNKEKQPIPARRTTTTGSPSTTRPVPSPAQRPQRPPRPSSSPPGEAAAANISKLLEMLDINKNEIAKQLKRKLGTNNNEVTNRVNELFENLEQLKRHINTTIPEDNDENSFLKLSGRDTYADKNFTLKSGVYRKIEGNDSGSESEERELDDFTGLEHLRNQSLETKPEHLDTQIENKDTLLNGADQIELDGDGVNRLQNRLLNCQKLEFYYLKKHDEVIKIFTFLLNLFDKYKYQGELLLFLLKYLVTKPDKPDRPYKSPTIKIPKSIILNIKKLIKDQDKIQEVINKMSTDINSNNPLTASRDPIVDTELGLEHIKGRPYSVREDFYESPPVPIPRPRSQDATSE